jgi:hypothetical protein
LTFVVARARQTSPLIPGQREPGIQKIGAGSACGGPGMMDVFTPS